MSALRPSNLPKLAVCPCYEGNPVAGPAAERGTLLDSAFRAELLGLEESQDINSKLSADELAAVAWAINMVRAMVGSEPILALEEDCRIQAGNLYGTADAIAPSKLIVFDLKTGARRNYREQMAAYALGLMEKHFAETWTAHLLFCDQREIETHTFSYSEAKGIVKQVLKAFNDPEKYPTPCEYCSWCAKAETCPARRTMVDEALASTRPDFDFDAVLADPDKLGSFLSACAVVDDFRARAKKAATERLKTGSDIPGWRLITRKGNQFVDYETVGQHIQTLGIGPVLAAYGKLSATKFRDLWSREMPADQPFPEGDIKQASPITYLKQTTNPNSNKHNK